MVVVSVLPVLAEGLSVLPELLEPPPEEEPPPVEPPPVEPPPVEPPPEGWARMVSLPGRIVCS